MTIKGTGRFGMDFVYQENPGNVEMDILPTVSIVIASHNEEKNIQRSICAIENIDYPRDLIETILVDSNSSDHTWDIGSGLCDVSVMIRSKYPSAGESFNAGVFMSQSKYVLISGGDIVLEPSFLKKAVEKLESRSDIAAITGQWRENDSSLLNSVLSFRKYEDPVNTVEYFDETPSGGLFRKSVLDDLNGYDERIRKGQETELGYRMREKRLKILNINTLQGFHDYDVKTITSLYQRLATEGISTGRFLFTPTSSSSKLFFYERKQKIIRSLMLNAAIYAFMVVCALAGYFVILLSVIGCLFLINAVRHLIKTILKKRDLRYFLFIMVNYLFALIRQVYMTKTAIAIMIHKKMLDDCRIDKKGLTGFSSIEGCAWVYRDKLLVYSACNDDRLAQETMFTEVVR